MSRFARFKRLRDQPTNQPTNQLTPYMVALIVLLPHPCAHLAPPSTGGGPMRGDTTFEREKLTDHIQTIEKRKKINIHQKSIKHPSKFHQKSINNRSKVDEKSPLGPRQEKNIKKYQKVSKSDVRGFCGIIEFGLFWSKKCIKKCIRKTFKKRCRYRSALLRTSHVVARGNGR